MNKEMKLAIWIGLAAVVSWFVAKSTAAATPVQAPKRKWGHAKAKGDVWAKPVVAAPDATNASAFPMAL